MSSISRVDLSQVSGLGKGAAPEIKGESFKNRLANLEARSERVSDGLRQGLERLENSWKVAYGQSSRLLSAVPVEFRPLLEMQMNMSKVHLQTELVTKVGDSVQGALKRLQQQG